MRPSELLEDGIGRVGEVVHQVLEGLSDDQLADRVDGASNSIAWLVWHLTRIQDDHVADVAGTEQVWTSQGWAERFDLPIDVGDTGWSHDSDQVAAVRASAELLGGYYDAVHEATLRYLRTVSDDDLERIVDERFDPPVTLGVRLVSVLSDDLQHAGQAAYVKGLLERRRG